MDITTLLTLEHTALLDRRFDTNPKNETTATLQTSNLFARTRSPPKPKVATKNPYPPITPANVTNSFQENAKLQKKKFGDAKSVFIELTDYD